MAERKINWPEAQLAGGDAMTLPEVSFGEVTGAGFTSEAIETDRWALTERTRSRYRGEALELAESLIGETFAAHPMDRPRSYDPATGYGALEAWDHSTQARQREDLMIRLAKRKHPDQFAEMPTTDDEIEAAVTAELAAQYQDAQQVFDAAPETWMGATIPEFVGRAGSAATDEIGLPLAIASLGIGEMANVGRVILTEAGLSVLGEAATLPKQYRMAERLGIEPPNPEVQLAFAAAVGAAVPAGMYGATRGLEFGARRLAGLSNREVVDRARRVDLTPAQRGAVNKIETAAAETETGPQARPGDGPGAVDGAIEDMAEPGTPPADGPPTSTARVEATMTPRRAPEPEVVPDLPEPEPAPGLPAAQTATPGSGRVQPSLEQNLANLIVSAEAGAGGYDAFSDFSVVFPQKAVTSMTLDEIDAFQTANIEAGAASSATGGPQFLRGTLRGLRDKLGLTGAETFTPELQNRLAVELMREAGLDAYRAGELSADAFADNLAGVWAGLPLADGRSRYAGDGLNAATVDRATVIAVLDGEEYQTAARALPGQRRVPASTLQVDARSYQFRSEVNEEGVGAGLDRVSVWDDMLAGDFIVHERLDGTRYVADGHHRTSLARRLEREGHAPIDVNARIFREADGYTVADVRALAAIKNIEAGSASAVDAAKVLRDAPGLMANLSLRQAQVRDARGLMQLGDDAFDMVTAGVIREDFAAVVGEMTRDGTMQSAILRALIQGRPANQAEARQMAADAYRSGLARRDADAQGSLFGDEFDVAETLFRERAKVMATALAKLRRDRSVFNTLVKEAGRIREAGNALTDESNLARVGTDEQALAIIERLANRAGPVDDALNAAAQTARSGRISDGVEQFLGVVRGAIERGELQSLLDGPPRSRGDGAQAPAGAGEGAGEPDPVAEAEDALYRALLARETDPERAAELTPAVREAVEALRAATPRLDDFDAAHERAEARAFAEADRQAAADGDLFGPPPTRQLEPEARIEDARLAADREAAPTEPVTPAPAAARPDPDSPELVDTRGQGIRFHGSRGAELEGRLQEGAYSSLNYYGQGFYTTDAAAIAKGYDKGGGIYTVRELVPVNAFDLEQPVPEWLVDALEEQYGDSASMSDLVGSAIDEAPATVRELFDEIRAFSASWEIPADDVQGIFESIEFILKDRGFNAMDHRGGLRTNKAEHGVRIYFDPHETVEVTRTSAEDFAAPAEAPTPRTERTPEGEQTLIEGVEPVTDRQRAEAAQSRPMGGARAGSAPLDEGLFDLGARGQQDLLDLARQPETPGNAGLWDDPDPDTAEFQAQVAVLEEELGPIITGAEDFEVPLGRSADDEAGESRAETMQASEIIADLDDDTEFLEALDVCKP